MIAEVEDALISKIFWTARISTTFAMLFIVWRIEIMNGLICTPAEFMPVLVGISLAIVALITFTKALADFYDKSKHTVDEGGNPLSYGLDYLTSNIAVVIIGTAMGFILPGLIYSALESDPTYSGCLILAIVVSVIIGFGGESLATRIVDAFRARAQTLN